MTKVMMQHTKFGENLGLELFSLTGKRIKPSMSKSRTEMCMCVRSISRKMIWKPVSRYKINI